MAQELLLYKSDTDIYDITGYITGAVTWAGRKSAAGRTLEFTALDAAAGGLARLGIDVKAGHRIKYSRDGEELFRGQVFKRGRGRGNTAQFKAWDNLIYLANNEDYFNFTNKTASEMFREVCARFNIPYGTIADTGHRCEDVKEKKNIWDLLLDGLAQTYKATNRRYYIQSIEGKAHLRERQNMASEWLLETGVNITDWNVDESAEKVATRVKVADSDGKVKHVEIDNGREAVYGIFQKITTPDSKDNMAKITTEAKNTLEANGLDTSLRVTGFGITECIAGMTVFAKVYGEDVNGVYYIDEDTHTFDGNLYTMALTLNKKPDSEFTD